MLFALAALLPALPLPARDAAPAPAAERSGGWGLRVRLDDVVRMRTHAALLLRGGAPGREAALDLASTLPLGAGNRPAWTSAQGRLQVPGYLLGLGLAVVMDHAGYAHRVRLEAQGATAAAFTFARWPSGSSASLAAQFGLGGPLPGLDLALGGAVTLKAGAAHPLPAAKVTLAPAPEWGIEAGLRPYLETPPWAVNLTSAADYLTLTPERAWLAWLAGRYRGLELRLGAAHGLIHQFRGAPRDGVPAASGPGTRSSVRRVADGTVLYQAVLEWEWAAPGSGAGDLTVRAASGAIGKWPIAAGQWPAARLLLDAAWPVAAEPPVAVLLRAGFLQAPLYGVEDWLATDAAQIGLSVAGGVRWEPAPGNQVRIIGGVRGHDEPDETLTLFVAVEYAHGVAPDRI